MKGSAMATLVHEDGREIEVNSPTEIVRLKSYGFVEKPAPKKAESKPADSKPASK